jgi:hypothetical protein
MLVRGNKNENDLEVCQVVRSISIRPGDERTEILATDVRVLKSNAAVSEWECYGALNLHLPSHNSEPPRSQRIVTEFAFEGLRRGMRASLIYMREALALGARMVDDTNVPGFLILMSPVCSAPASNVPMSGIKKELATAATMMARDPNHIA